MDIQIHIHKEMELNRDELNNPVVLIGWPGIALVAKLALTSIKDFLGAKLLHTIECFDFPAKANAKNGILELPTAQVFYIQRETSDLFFLTADFQPESSKGVFEFSKTFCDEMDKLTDGHIKMYLSMGALVSDSVSDPPLVHICGTDPDLLNSFLEQENTKILESGVIAGANGILPAYAHANNYAPGFCLLAETIPLPMMSLDPRASKALVTLLDNYLKINMDFKELDKKIDEMQGILDNFKRQADNFMKRGMEEDKGPVDSYFR